MKNKLIVLVLGLFLALTGCNFTVSLNTNGKTNHQTPSSQPTTDSNSNSGSSNTNSDSSQPNGGTDTNQNTGTSDGSSTTNSNPSTNHPAPQINMSMVTAIRLADFQTGWIGGNGWIAKTLNGGKGWTVVYQGSGSVQQIFALNHSDVWATLNGGGNVTKLLHSNDGGAHWSFIATTPNNAFLHFISNSTALSGNALSIDGGKTWHTLPTPAGTVGDAYFHDSKNGWVVTETNSAFYVNRTTDGGKTWETVMTKSLSERLISAQIRSAGTNDAWVELIGGTGMTQTSYSVFHTSDGGKSWNTVIANSTAGGGPAPGFNQYLNNGPSNKGSKPGPLYVVNTQVAFMGGSCPACDNQNSIGWTKDAGKTWINSNATFEGNGDAFLAFADANHGWWITTSPSKMYTTSDGGLHWKEVYLFH